MAIADNDPRLLAFKALLEAADDIEGFNDPDSRAKAQEALLDRVGFTLRDTGIADHVGEVFAATCPEFDRRKPEHVANFQQASAELICRILMPVMPGASGKHLFSQLYCLSQGDDAPLFDRTKVRNRQVPTSIPYSAAKALLVYRAAYAAAKEGTGFIKLLAKNVPGYLGGADLNQIRKDWAKGDFVDQAKLEICKSAGEARSSGGTLSPDEQAVEQEVLVRSFEEIAAVIVELRRKAPSRTS